MPSAARTQAACLTAAIIAPQALNSLAASALKASAFGERDADFLAATLKQRIADTTGISVNMLELLIRERVL